MVAAAAETLAGAMAGAAVETLVDFLEVTAAIMM